MHCACQTYSRMAVWRAAKYGLIGISLLVENRIKSKKEGKDHIPSKISKGEKKERKENEKTKEDEMRSF